MTAADSLATKKLCRVSLWTVLVACLALFVACSKRDSLHMELRISPDPPRMIKPAAFVLHITGANGQPVSNANVTGILAMKSMDMGKTELKFSPKGNGDYEASTKEMDMSGQWDVTVDAALGSAHTKQTFDFAVGD